MKETCESCVYHEQVYDDYNGATVGHRCWRPIVPVMRSKQRETPRGCPDHTTPTEDSDAD